MGLAGILDGLPGPNSGGGMDVSSMKNLDQFLEEVAAAAPQTRCVCCNNAELAAVIVEFLDKLKNGETSVTLGYFHQHYLVPRFKKPKWACSVRDHVRCCLRRDCKTGEPLDG